MNEKFTIVIETLEAAEKEMSELHNVMEGLEQRMEASWHEVQTIADYRKRLSSMGQVVRSMLAKRETALLEKVRAEHRVQADGAYCTCENSNFFVSDLGLTCWSCKKPRR